MNDVEGRRPIKTRDAKWSQRFARWLSTKPITPNQISVTSVFFAAAAAGCLAAMPFYVEGPWPVVLPIAAGVCIQCRLLCNLFDGMVAVEGGKGTASGAIFNELPDRVADVLILVAAGYGALTTDWGPTLGWAAGLTAVMTAYVRALGTAVGAPTEFRGPMAKSHRMALITAACAATAFLPVWPEAAYVMPAALGVVIVGCIVTSARRARAAYLHLERSAHA